MNEVQVLVFDRVGKLLAEIEPEIESVAWRLNWYGQAPLFLPYTDSKCTRDILQYGNRVLIRFSEDVGLPDFGGPLDTPRKRTSQGVKVTAYGGEKFLDWRETAQNRVFSQVEPGAIFQALIEEENEEWATGVVVDQVGTGGTPRSPEYHYHDLLRRIRDLADLTGYDFVVRPVYEGGQLSFWTDWYVPRRGRDLRDQVWLIEGRNLVKAELDEQGQIASRVILAGEGSSWGPERPVKEKEDVGSRNDYGYREWADVQMGVTDPTTLEANAEEILAQMKDPRQMLSVEALNEEPAPFETYDVGDIVSVNCFLEGGEEWAFDGAVRVVAREWRPEGTCRLEVEVWE